MIKYAWDVYESAVGPYAEVRGVRFGTFGNKQVSEARLFTSLDEDVIRINWIYVPKDEQGHGYATKLLENIKENISNHFTNFSTIAFTHVTSLRMINLIKSVFPTAEVDFFHLPNNMIEIRKEEFKNNPWIPESSPAVYSKNGACTISKNAPGVNLLVQLTR